jgi:two-component system response regulator
MAEFEPVPILVVEDSPDDCSIFEDAVNEARLANSLQYVVDGEEAIAYMRGDGKFEDRETYPLPGLVFLDINLPKVDGLDVLEEIRSMPEFEDLPVIMLTVSNSDDDVLRSYELGTIVFIQKPVTAENLTTVIQSLGQFQVQFVGPAA